MAVHEAVVAQRDYAEKECKETIVELKLMTQELKNLTREMKEQSDIIEEHLKTIEAQKMTIQDLATRIAILEKDEPDLSIYEDTMACSDERQEELDAVNTAVVLILVVAACMIAVLLVAGMPLSDIEL